MNWIRLTPTAKAFPSVWFKANSIESILETQSGSMVLVFGSNEGTLVQEDPPAIIEKIKAAQQSNKI